MKHVRTLSVFLVLFCLAGVSVHSEPTSDNSTKKTTQKKQTKKAKQKKQTKKDTASKTTPAPIIERHYPPPGSSGQIKNYDFLLKRKSYPDGEVTPEMYMAAHEQARKLPVYSRRSAQTPQATNKWVSVGPFGIGGRVSTMAMHPTDSNIFYVGAAAGGVWKTIDRGNTWKNLTDTFRLLPSGYLTIDPHNPETVYYGQGEPNNSADSYPGNGLYRTTDGGTSWSHLGLEKTRSISQIIVDPIDRNIIYVCAPGPTTSADSNRGIYKTTDFGVTWKNVLLVRGGPNKTSRPIPIIDLVMNPRNNQELVAAAWDKSFYVYTGLWHSLDAGASWKRIDTAKTTYPNALKDKRFGRSSLLWVNAGASSVLYSVITKTDTNIITGYATDENLYALFKTTDPAADSWTKCIDSSFRIPYKGNNVDSVDLFYRQGSYNNFLAGNPKRPNEIYIGGIDVVRSTDGGTTFTNITRGYPAYFSNDRTQHSDQHGLGFSASGSGNDLYVNSDGGVFHTTNFGDTWEQLKGIPMTMLYYLKPWEAGMKHLGDNFPPDSLKFIGGTQDNGSISKGLTNEPDWRWINRGDGGWAQAHPTDSEKIITSIQLGKVLVKNTLESLRPNLATDEGNAANPARWYQISKILTHGDKRLTDTNESCAFIPPVVLDNERPNELYTPRTRLYRAKIDWANPDNTTWSVWSPQTCGTPNKPSNWYTGYINAVGVGVRDENMRPMLWIGGLYNGARTSLYRSLYDPTLHQDSMPRWIRADTGLTPPAYVSCIVPDRSDSLKAFCSLSSFSTNRLFMTVNGTKWTSITGDLPSAPITSFIIDTVAEQGNPLAKNQCIIVGTDIGVFVTTNGGKNWATLGEGLPPVVVEQVSRYKNYLIAATHARGAFVIDISDLRAEPLNSVRSGSYAGKIVLNSVRPNPYQITGTPLTLNLTNGEDREENIFVEVINASTGVKMLSQEIRIGAGKADIELQQMKLTNGAYMIILSDEKGLIATEKISVVQ
jgi:Ni/Co efflux regulator RcnB